MIAELFAGSTQELRELRVHVHVFLLRALDAQEWGGHVLAWRHMEAELVILEPSQEGKLPYMHAASTI